MREDMFKVIVERPRHGAHPGFSARGRLARDGDLPPKIGLNRHAVITGRQTKSLNENLQPLKRFLGKQVGRPWNKVFSEIAATLAPGHTVKEHVRQHIGDFVACNIAIGRDGEWLDASRRNFGDRSYPWRQALYVDPRDGILKDSAKYWKKHKAVLNRWIRPVNDTTRDEVRKLDGARELRRVGGVWYEIAYARNPDALPEQKAFDLVRREYVSARSRHAAAKRQLSRSELQSHAIVNAPG